MDPVMTSTSLFPSTREANPGLPFDFIATILSVDQSDDSWNSYLPVIE